MRTRTFASAVLLAVGCVAAASLSGCQSTSGDSTMRESVRASSSLADVQSQIAGGRAQLAKVSASLDSMMSSGGNVSASFSAFTKEVAALNTTGERSRARWQDMKNRAATYMENWQEELAGMSTEDIKALNSEQLASFRTDFNSLVDTAKSTGEAFDPLMTRLNDLRTSLASNLSPSSLERLKPQIAATRSEIASMDTRLGTFSNKLDAFAQRWAPHGTKAG